MTDLIKITVIGDERVGKTSLITAAATESFPERPPPLLPPTKLPPETTTENIPILVTDTSSRPEDRQSLELAICQADAIVLLFDTGQNGTLRRISSHWMPLLQQLGVQCPVILCGCKADLERFDQNHLQEVVAPIMSNYRQIETCLECSSQKLIFTGEVFSYAVKAVVNPVSPLFDPQAQDGEGRLKDLCVRALRRVFLMCDQDQDGILSDDELNAFQIKCFSAPLQPEELSGVKAVVASKMRQGVKPNGLTLPGFLFLHALFIERGRLEATWAVLRKFGYDNTLHLHADILDAVNLAHAPDQAVELTDTATSFLMARMHREDADGDGALSRVEQLQLFATAPDNPWERAPYSNTLVETSKTGHPTLEGCLSWWKLMANTDPRSAVAYSLYLGFDGEPASLLQITRPRRQERKAEQRQRTVYKCLLCGPQGAGKSTLLHGLVHHSPPDNSHAYTASVATISSATDISPGSAHLPWLRANSNDAGPAATLIAHEVGDRELERLLASPRAAEELGSCDVAAFAFDSTSPESFRGAHLAMMRVAEASGNALPCVFLAAKDDLAMPRELEAQCGAVCAKLGISPPLGVSRGDLGELGAQLLRVALRPSHAIPETPSLQVARQYRRMLKSACIYLGVGASVAVAGYAIYRLADAKLQQKPSDNGKAQIGAAKSSN